MKKTHLTILLMLYCSCSLLMAQLPVCHQVLSKASVLDTAAYVVTYELSFIQDLQKPEEITKDIVELQIGKNNSKSFSRLLYEADSTYGALIQQGARNVPLFQKSVPPVIVHKDYLKKKNTVIYRTFLTGPIFEYTESRAEIDWKLQGDKATILGYDCQKAIGTFYGRTYEAWFTSQLPLREGPYKFEGLPGLILRISDTQEHYVFNCIGIKKTSDVPILFWKWNAQKTSREKLNAFVEKFHTHTGAVAKSLGIRLYIYNKDGSLLTSPYNPIELE